MRITMFVFIMLILLMMGAIALLNWRVLTFSKPLVGDAVAKLPCYQVALLLGTAPRLVNGRTNLYFAYRIQAAAELYHAGKIRHIIASGSRKGAHYNEPDEMIAALVQLGVPAEKITADYAGVRTLDSVLRARDVFEQYSYIVVSQKFHNERAVYLARHHGMQAVGFNAQDVGVFAGWKTQIREYLARVKMFGDLLLKRQAKYAGEKIAIPD